MTTLRINLNLKPTDRLPIHAHYDGQHYPQQSGLELDTRTGELTTFINGEVGNAVPEDVWNNIVLRFAVSPYASARAIAELADWHSDFFQAILDDQLTAQDALNHWYEASLGEVGDTHIITVTDQMQYEKAPTNEVELARLVDILIGYDGEDNMLYETAPTPEAIRTEVLEYLVDYEAEEITAEMATIIRAAGIECDYDPEMEL